MCATIVASPAWADLARLQVDWPKSFAGFVKAGSCGGQGGGRVRCSGRLGGCLRRYETADQDDNQAGPAVESGVLPLLRSEVNAHVWCLKLRWAMRLAWAARFGRVSQRLRVHAAEQYNVPALRRWSENQSPL